MVEALLIYEGFSEICPYSYSKNVLKIKKHQTEISGEEWKETRLNILLKKRIYVRFEDDKLHPVAFSNLKDIRVSLDGDVLRDFNLQNQETQILTQNKFLKFAKLLTTLFVVIMAVAVVVIGLTLIGKYSSDQMTILQGVAGNDFLSNFTDRVLGG